MHNFHSNLHQDIEHRLSEEMAIFNLVIDGTGVHFK